MYFLLHQSLTAVYNNFEVADESSKYQLTLGSIDTAQSTTGIRDGMSGRTTRSFSTTDEDNDPAGMRDCANHLGGGFWYGLCYFNGVSVTGAGDKFGWRNNYMSSYALQKAEMYACN